MGDARIIHGDLREVLPTLDEASVDACVCDPPYELGFMGRGWDRSGIANDPDTWRHVLRVLRPGGHLVAFGGTRTHHRLMCAIEDAGFEIRDCLMWLYASGFPKSIDVSKAIDDAAGAERERVGPVAIPRGARNGTNALGGGWQEQPMVPRPATDAAREWDGWGTALKPAFEPIVLARKPLGGTVAANVVEHGTGALNINSCRIPWANEQDRAAAAAGSEAALLSQQRHQGENRITFGGLINGEASLQPYLDKMEPGRWPANVLLDEAAADMLDAQTGDRPGMSGGGVHREDYGGGLFGAIDCPGGARADSGGASRFFFCAKATTAEREAGLHGMPREAFVQGYAANPDASPDRSGDIGLNRVKHRANFHPTVKPVDLMRWLVRLVTPPGGLVLDPFAGSGSTGMACVIEGARFVGVELLAEHVEIARRRIAACRLGKTVPLGAREKAVDTRQVSLFGGDR